MAEIEYSHRVDDQGRHVCDAHQDGRNVGYTVTVAVDQRDWLWLDEVYVKPGFRGQGIARALLDCTIARHQGREIRLKPEPYGAQSGLPLAELVAFYEGCGFRWDGASSPPRLVFRPQRKPMQKPTLGSKVRYVGDRGAFSPRTAIVTCSQADVQPGTDLAPLSSDMHVYLWVFTPRSAGFAEADVPYDESGAPGTWSWPPQV